MCLGTRPAGMMRIRVALVIGCAIALAGCIDIEQEIVLEPDLSGTASLRMRVDMEPMVYFMAMMSRQMAGESGEPTAEALQATRNQLLAQQEQEDEFDIEKFKAAQGASLPEGIRVRDVRFSRRDLQLSYAVDFEFDRFEDIVLDQDLSGTASLRMHVDMEPMVYFMAMMSRQMAGGSGEPTAE